MQTFLQLLKADLLAQDTHWITLVVLVSVVIIWKYVPTERKYIRNTLLLYGLYFLLVPIAQLLQTVGFLVTGGSLLVVAVLMFRLTLVNFGSVLVFEVFLPVLRISLPRIIRDISILVAYVMVTFSLLAKLGVNITSLITTSAIVTAVIGLSLQDTLGNVMAGLTLQLEHAIQEGDWVKVDEHIGQVKEVRWRFTSIETRNWDTVIIPNSQLVKGQVLIYGKRQKQPLQTRRWIYFNVDFRFPPAEVIERIDNALQKSSIPGVAATPAPHTLLYDFKDSVCQYAVRYWLTDLAIDAPTDSIVRTRIFYALKRAGITPSIPAQRIFTVEENKKWKERKEEQVVQQRLNALQSVDLFRTFNESELRDLSIHLVYSPFSRGEDLTRQGDEAHWLYILTKGSVSVHVAVKDPVHGELREKEVRRLGPGDIFGEMSLMTGQPRLATVTALEDVECFRLDKDAFQSILIARPQIAEDISHILAKRRLELDATVAGIDEELQQSHVKATQNQMLGLIREFFGL